MVVIEMEKRNEQRNESTTVKVFAGLVMLAVLSIGSFLVVAMNENGTTGQTTDGIGSQTITERQAVSIASQQVDGPVTDVEIEQKFGHTVYAVEIDNLGDETDVYVDVTTGAVVGIERDSEEPFDDDVGDDEDD